ncbi:transposase [Curtanaerobium respiraculi]|uniref:transposase n=1 Tax=Curtanaerobium respiraculi TaxID=2949669 RepID=UPI0024B3BE84|nr:transposase [Curtanaerobium respiraculi]
MHRIGIDAAKCKHPAAIIGEGGKRLLTGFELANDADGCDPSAFESGEMAGTRAKMSERGSPYLRWCLWLAADRARRYDPALGAHHTKKRAGGKCHKVAVSAVVRKLCSIIFAVLRDNRPYVRPAD